MIFSTLMNLTLAFFGPIGAATLMVGDWVFNAFLIVKTVEYVVPNGPAIVGNVSQMIPVVANIVYSTLVPLLGANYSGLVNQTFGSFNEYTGNITEYILSASASASTSTKVNDEL